MIHLRNVKLRTQLIILVCIGIITLIAVQAIYYMKFTNLTVDRANIYARSITEQMQDKMNNIIDSIEKAGNAIAYNPTVQNCLNTPEPAASTGNVNGIFTSIIQLNSNFSGISLLGNDGQVLASSDYNDFGTYINSRIYDKFLMDDHDRAFFTPLYEVEKNKSISKYYCYIIPIFNIARESPINKKIGYCILFCRTDLLQVNVRSTSVSGDSLFCIIDSAQNIVASNRKSITGQKFDTDAYMSELNGGRFDNRKFINLSVPIKNMDWKIVATISVYELTSELRDIRNSAVIIIIAAIFLFLGTGWIFIRSMTRPITQIVNTMIRIGDKNLKQRVETNVTNEIGIIAHNINSMLDKIEGMTRSIFTMQSKLYEAELNKKEAEFLALQSQINPHFLYNTLECIRSMGIEHDIIEIAQITSAMARIFRYSIKAAHFTEVREELKCMSDYMKIVSFRFMDKISYEIQVEERLMDVKIVKMILQPILENAVCHGLENKQGKGGISVKGYIKGNNLLFEIVDDGVGMSQEELESLNMLINAPVNHREEEMAGRRSIGLVNIHRRIKYNYGEPYGITIQSNQNQGTKVTVEFPFKENMMSGGAAGVGC